MLPSDREAPGTETLAIVSDKRARHFWDAAGVLPPLFHGPLGLPDKRPAWDVYLIYPPGTRWKDEPPAPLYWEHQLGHVTTAPRLDGKTFSSFLKQVLEQHGTGRCSILK